jgi:hypothetical protein
MIVHRFFRPSGGSVHSQVAHPRLAPWAAFFRSFGAAPSDGRAACTIPDLKLRRSDCDIGHRL